MTPGQAEEGLVDLGRDFYVWFCHVGREHTGRFDKLDIVQKYERLERGIGSATGDRADLARRRVEGHHVRQRRGSLPYGIQRATVQIAADGLLIGGRHGVGFAPEITAWLIR